MLRANNEANEDVYIDDSVAGEKYHCPICDMPVFRKIGNGLRRAHFAHNKTVGSGTVCDGWHYDMSEWHREWQERFPIECREVVVSFEGKKHRADVLIEKQKLVIEFQHSRLSPEEYAERNQFYINAGYQIIWLFDMTEDFKEERFVVQEDSEMLLWKRPWSTFRTIQREENKPKNKWQTNVMAVFFENDRLIARLLRYDSDSKTLLISSVRNSIGFFEWSDYTFTAYLKDFFGEHYLSVPNCPKCHLPMLIRRHSITKDLFWGCQNFNSKLKGKNEMYSCKEMIHFAGMLPKGLSTSGGCLYCGSDVTVWNNGYTCSTCGFAIKYQH